jgi:hypothetical protein
MMKSAQPCTGGHGRIRRRLAFDRPLVRRVLLKGIVNPILIVVINVTADEPSKMALIEGDDMVEKLPATASDPAFRNPVLLRCLNAGALRLQAG